MDSVAELVALLKSEPGKDNFGLIGNGSLSHLAMEALTIKAARSWSMCPIGASPQAMTAPLARRRPDGLPAVDCGYAARRDRQREDFGDFHGGTAPRSSRASRPWKEGGIDVEADAPMGITARAGTPAPVQAKIHREVVEAVTLPAIRDKSSRRN